MHKLSSIAVLSLALVAASAFAANDPDATATPRGKQQATFSLCSKDAKAHALKGDDRRHFMSTCLKAKA